jgi:penicillin-binding protein 1A
MRSLFLIVLLFISILLIGMGVIVWCALDEIPDIDALKNYQPPQSSIVLDRNGEVVGRFFDERRTVISLKKLPIHVTHAFIAAEDADFFEHRGIDYFGLMRAFLLEIKYRTIGGRRVGGSTITQQTARTILLSSAQTYVRKLKEIILAQRIENTLTKEQILHLYLNQIYFGNGAYGIEEAAQTYFLKPAAKLTIFEAAALAAVPKSPNRINPFGDGERLKSRQHYVLDQMVKHKFIEPHEAQLAKSTPLFSDIVDHGRHQIAPYFLRSVKVELLAEVSDEVIRRGGLKVYSTLDINMQKIAEEAMTAGLKTIDKRSGYRGPLFRPTAEEDDKLKISLDVFRKRAFNGNNTQKIWDLSQLSKESVKANPKLAVDNIRLMTMDMHKAVGARVLSVNDHLATIDLGSRTASLPLSLMLWARPYSSDGTKSALRRVSEIFKTGDIILVKMYGDPRQLLVSLEQEPEINGGLVALDVATGGVLAMVGGYDFERSPFNRITQSKKQPGSGIKPLIYALAIDRELVTASSIITDVPKAFLNPGTNEFWRPRNHTHKYLGDITLRRCLRSSINTCTITLLERLGIDTFLQFAKDVELNTTSTPYPRNLTIALGSAENYPISIANAMRVLARNGLYSPYHLIDGIKHGTSKREAMFEAYDKVVLRPESAFIVSHILKEAISHSKRRVYLSDVAAELTGKTGTTNEARNTMFFGYSPSVIALVNVGYDDNRSVGDDAWGITTAFPIWAAFMNALPTHRDEHKFIVPENIEWRYVDRESGRAFFLPTTDQEFPPHVVLEAFIKGTAPEISGDDRASKASPHFVDEDAFAP